MAADALAFDQQRMAARLMSGCSGGNFAAGPDQEVILGRGVRGSGGIGPYRPARIMALAAEVDFGLVLRLEARQVCRRAGG